MPTMSAPDPRELLVSFLVLRLGLLSEQRWVGQFNAWEFQDVSFGEWLERGQWLSSEQVRAVQQLATSLLSGVEDSDQQLARYVPPQHVVSSLLSEPSCHEWLPRLMEVTRSIQADTTLDELPQSADSLDVGDSATRSGSGSGDAEFDVGPTARNLMASRRYEVLQTHAEGGLGRVSLAEDRELGRNVALKQIKAATTASSRRRFIFEAEVTGQLEHPGIIPVYSLASDEDGQPFYTMRFVDGDTLGDAIKRYHRNAEQDPLTSVNAATETTFAFRQLLNRFVDLCNAMDYAHHRGFIHRDLKPSNVMLGRFGETLVVDWGLARKLDRESDDEEESTTTEFIAGADATQPGAVVGTPAYMSPEQASGHTNSLTSASDIFSLGSILYTILTGRRAFPDKDVTSILDKVRKGDFYSPREVERATPRPLNAICLKAMSHDPDERYPSARDLAEDIERWLADEPVAAWPEPLPVRARRWMNHHRVAVASSVVGLAIATVGLGVVLAVQSQANRKLTEANTKERAATAEAERQFDFAVSAIEKYHDDVASDFLLGQAEFRELRESLLKAPRAFYAQLTQQIGDQNNPSRRQRVSLYNAHIQLADLAEDLASYEDSISSYEKAESILDDLLMEFPKEAKYAEDRVRINQSLGFLHGMIGQPKEAERILQEGERNLQSFKPEKKDKQTWQMLRARLLRQRATLFSEQSREKEASACYEASLAIRRQLVAAEPEVIEHKSELAGTLNDYGTLIGYLGNVDQSEAATREGAELQELVVKSKPEGAFELYRLASMYTNLAYILQATDRADEAIEVYEQSEPLFRQLAAEGANIVVFQSGLASTLNNLGLLHGGLQNFDKADAYYREALKIKERLVVNHPLSVDFKVSLGGGYSNFGGYHLRKGDAEASLEWFGRSVDTLGEVLNENPGQTTALAFSRAAYANRASAFRELERHLEAASDYLSASEHQPDPNQRRSMTHRYAQSLALGGKHQAAITEADKLEATAESDRDFFDLCFIYALSVTSVEDSETLSQENREQLITDYTQRAVKSLRSMWDTGQVPKEIFQNLLETNEYIQPLHGKPAFEAFREAFDR
ncbi:MAG: serine/threonine-protein kinase [Planctomycetota bacterium]